MGDTEIVQEGVQQLENMEIEHDIVTQETMSLNSVAETITMDFEEFGISTQELVSLKIFVEVAAQTEPADIQEVVVQSEVETVETWEVAVHTEDEEVTTHFLNVQTQ